MAASSDTAISIHPLAVLNIADHFTRVNVGKLAGGPAPRVFGMLFGTQDGRKVDICASVEMLCPPVDGKPTLRRDIFDKSLRLYLEVFPKHELLGWYSTGTDIGPGDIELHRSISGDGLWYLFLNTGPATPGELPLSIYALETRLVDGGVPRQEFVRFPMSVATFEMERITLDHVSTMHSAADTESALRRQLGNASTAAESLSSRVAILVDYLQRVKSGEVTPDPALLRQLSALCSRLPVIDVDGGAAGLSFTKDLLTDRNDTLLMTFLGSITKSAGALSDFTKKADLVQDKRRKGGMSGHAGKFAIEMVSLFLTLPNDPSVTATCRSSNGKSMALSIADLTALRAQLKSQGRSLIHELRSRRVLDARTAADPIPTEQELFDPAVPVTVTVPPELAARRQYLQARSEEREYAQLVSSVQGHVVAEKNRESFAQFHQQASLGMNLILSIATATLCGYFIGRYSSPDKAWILAAVFGIGMLFIDAVLIILRLTQIDKQSAKKSAKDASQPLGVRVGVKERKGGQRLPLPSSPVKEVFDAVPSSSLPSSSTPDLDAALRAFHTLVGPTADNLPSPTPSADVSGTVTLGNDSPATPKDASAQTGVRRRRRAD